MDPLIRVLDTQYEEAMRGLSQLEQIISSMKQQIAGQNQETGQRKEESEAEKV